MSRVERAFARIAEGQVHYRVVRGDDTLPPIVLLHASPSSSRSTAPLAEALAFTGRTIIAPDTLATVTLRRLRSRIRTSPITPTAWSG